MTINVRTASPITFLLSRYQSRWRLHNRCRNHCISFFFSTTNILSTRQYPSYRASLTVLSNRQVIRHACFLYISINTPPFPQMSGVSHVIRRDCFTRSQSKQALKTQNFQLFHILCFRVWSNALLFMMCMWEVFVSFMRCTLTNRCLCAPITAFQRDARCLSHTTH